MFILGIELRGYIPKEDFKLLEKYTYGKEWLDLCKGYDHKEDYYQTEIQILGNEFNIKDKIDIVIDYLKSINFKYDSRSSMHIHISHSDKEITRSLLINWFYYYTQHTSYEFLNTYINDFKKWEINKLRKSIYESIIKQFNFKYTNTIIPYEYERYADPLMIGSHHSAIGLSKFKVGLEFRIFKMTLNPKIIKSHIRSLVKGCYDIANNKLRYDALFIKDRANTF